MFGFSWLSLHCLSRAAVASASLAAALTVSPPLASAGPGYELDPVKPSISLDAELPHGIAIDQTSQAIYVTELSTNLQSGGHGQIEQFSSSGVATASSPFFTGGEDFFAGVAVNPVTHGIFAYQTQLSTPFGIKGTPQIDTFSSTGVAGTSFSPTKSTAAQLATDSSGHIYFPNDSSGTVQVFSSSGSLERSIACTSCPGGDFVKPEGVAMDSTGNLYVVDIDGGGRVVKFKPSGGSYEYDSVLQTGEGAVAVGVDPASNDVFVGDFAEGHYHVVALDSSGTQFDNFGGGIVGGPPYGIETSGQIAANATTHKVYVTDPSSNKIWIFDRIASIPAPTATTSPAAPVGQIEATLKAAVNPNGHGLKDCHFEYTDHSDFLANGFADATAVPCVSKPVGSTSTAISALTVGLATATVYDYRIAVASNGGSVEGGVQAFETLPPLAPSVTTGAASAITPIAATLAGTVNTHGGAISACHFEYTTDADFQQNAFTKAASAACSPPPQGTMDTAVSAKIKGLTAGSSYRFRLVATNNSGITEASSQGFATPVDTCATNPALCPPSPEERGSTPPPVGEQPPGSVPPPTLARKPIKCRKGFKKKTVHGKAKCVKVHRHR